MIYLDNAATTFPKPPEVVRAVKDFMENSGGNPGRGGHELSRRAGDIVYNCREALAELFNIDNPERIVFTKNATEAINTAINGIVGEGDEIIISGMEHNSVLRPAVAKEQLGSRLKIVPADRDGRITPEAVEAMLSPRTKLVCVIHASNVVGTVNDIAAINDVVHSYGALTLFDAAQTAGLLPIDASDFDFLAFAGHKGLYGPTGTGGLYVREGLMPRPLTMGGTGSISESALMPDIFPDRIEAGTVNAAGIAGLLEGVNFVKAQAPGEHEHMLAKKLAEKIGGINSAEIMGDNGVNVVGVRLRNIDCVDAAARLDSEYGIASRGGLHCSPLAHRSMGSISGGLLRLSTGAFTTEEDIDAAARALEEIIKNQNKAH